MECEWQPTGHGIHTLVDQPARERALPFAHGASVFVAPVHQARNKLRAGPGLCNTARDPLPIRRGRYRRSLSVETILDIG